MKATSSSSPCCKRLMPLLVVLLPIFCNRLLAEEPFDALIEKQSVCKANIEPYIEEVEASPKFAIPSIITSIEDRLEPPPPFSLDTIDPPLLGEDYLTKKRSPFRAKKTINFSKEIAKDEKEELSPLPFIAEKNEPPLIIDPNLEQKKETKHDFLSKKVPFSLENLPSKSSRPYSFEHPQDEESSLINRDFSHKKTESIVSPSLKELKTAQPTSTYIAAEKMLNFSPQPTNEKVDRGHFLVDDCYFHFDDYFPTTIPYPLESHDIFSLKLIKDYKPHEKKFFSGKGYFAEGYFKSLKWTDISKITKQNTLAPLFPSVEVMETDCSINGIDVALEITQTRPFLFEFEEISFTFDLPYKSFQQEKMGLELSLLDSKTFEISPYIYIKPLETLETSTPFYHPSREKASPLPSKYSLPQGPTVALEFNHEIMTFTLTPEFDLYCSIEAMNLPKKAQEFHESALAMIHPYLYVEPHEHSDEKILTPKPEKQSPLAFSETIDALTFNPSTDSSPPLVTERKDQDSLAIISRSIEFPHLKTPSSPMEFSLKTEGLYRSPLEVTRNSTLFLPSTEKMLPPVFDSTLNLEIAPEKSLETFALSHETFTFDPTLNHPSLPKHHHKTRPSKLDIKRSYIGGNETFIEDVAAQNDYYPSTQEGEKKFSKTLPNFSLPKSQTSLFAFETEKNLSIDMQDSEVHYEKFTNREATTPSILDSSLNDLNLPYVTGKKILPNKPVIAPKKAFEGFTEPEKIIGLANRNEKFPNTRLIFEGSPIPTSIQDENLLCQDNQHPLLSPLRPSYYPPEVPSLDIATTTHSIKEKHLEYVKKKVTPLEGSPDDLILPHVAGKRIVPNKPVMTPKSAFEDFPEADKVIGLANRDENFPNTRGLLKGDPVPIRIQSEITFSEGKLSPLKTEMIHSHSKNILENYHQETLVSLGKVSLTKPELEGPPSDSEKRSLNQSNRFTNAFLSEIPPPSHLETVSYNNEFDTSIHYSKREDGKGYLFSIKMKPVETLNFASPNQHYVFVVDGSSSIKKHRFGVFKEGVGRALSYLGEGDSFNIVIADAEMIPFSKEPTLWNETSVSKAKRFLMDQNYRGFFINYNAFDLLSNVSNYFAPDKENIVVLITDGHSFRSLEDHKNDFKELVKESKGKFSVFTATASQGNNLSMLDLLSTFNNGELMYSKTNASFSRQLSVLVKHIESFVAKDIHVNVTSINNETRIEFYPNEKTLPSLYADRPYIIYGSIDQLKDFDLILQGRCGDKWINIKQTISFKHAEKATHSIKKGMALQKAYVCYDYFLKNDDPFFLKEAQNILEPLHIPTAVR
ncbi:MAG: hypothetical protein H7A41_02880 [Chlamydiales bacterium]|nr:hypothetical protein [Chlamydiales bacterium]